MMVDNTFFIAMIMKEKNKNYIEKIKKSINIYRKKGLKELQLLIEKKNNNNRPKNYNHTDNFYLKKHRLKKKREKQKVLFSFIKPVSNRGKKRKPIVEPVVGGMDI